jgi:hypothetical protein
VSASNEEIAVRTRGGSYWPIWLCVCVSLPVLLRNLYHIINSYALPALMGKRAFIEDFAYFYGMGQRLVYSPAALYSDIDHLGTFMVSLDRWVFHPYPPLAALLFIPLTFLPVNISYVAYIIIVYVIGVVLVAWIVRLTSAELGVALGAREKGLAILAVIGTAPVFMDAAAGNMDVIQTAWCVAVVVMAMYRRPVVAGGLLALAVWLKVYAVLLLPLIFLMPGRWRMMVSFGVLLIVPPFLLQSFVPLSLYGECAGILQAYSHQTFIHPQNQSIVAVVTRFLSSPEKMYSWESMPTETWVRAMAYAVVGGMAALVLWRYYRDSIHQLGNSQLRTGFCLLALMPMATPVGWGHTWCLALPLLAYAIIWSLKQPFIIKCLVCLVFVNNLLPHYTEILHGHVPAWVECCFHARYPVLTTILILVLTFKRIESTGCHKSGCKSEAEVLASPLAFFRSAVWRS